MLTHWNQYMFVDLDSPIHCSFGSPLSPSRLHHFSTYPLAPSTVQGWCSPLFTLTHSAARAASLEVLAQKPLQLPLTTGSAKGSQKVTSLKQRHTVCYQTITSKEGQHQSLRSSFLVFIILSLAHWNSIWLFLWFPKNQTGSPQLQLVHQHQYRTQSLFVSQINTQHQHNCGQV